MGYENMFCGFQFSVSVMTRNYQKTFKRVQSIVCKRKARFRDVIRQPENIATESKGRTQMK